MFRSEVTERAFASYFDNRLTGKLASAGFRRHDLRQLPLDEKVRSRSAIDLAETVSHSGS